MEMEHERVGGVLLFVVVSQKIELNDGKENATPNSENAEPSEIREAWKQCRSMKPSWIMCGCLVVAPLPPVGVLLTDTGGSCDPPTLRDQEGHLEAWGNKEVLVILILE